MESRSSGYRVLVAAIALSFAVHLFWLCAVRIVVSPIQPVHARPSRVTFLGPILTKARTEVMAARSSRSYLEERYVKRFDRPDPGLRRDAVVRDARHEGAPAGNSAAETRYVGLVGAAMEKEKVEPEYGAE